MDAAAGFTDLHHRAFVDEQAGEFDRFGQRTAAVVAQIDHHAVEILRSEAAQQFFGIAGGGRIVVAVAALAFKILIERRQFDHADAARGLAVDARHIQHLALRGLFFQPDLRAVKHDPVRLAVQHRFGRHDIQTHLGTLRAFDLADHIIDAPADDIFHRAVGALAHGHDAVAGFELAAEDGRATGDQLTDHYHVVLLLQLRADPFQRQAHALLEAFGRARVEIIGVRVDRCCVCIEEGLERIDAVELRHALGQIGVALVQGLADLVGLLARQLQTQPVVADRLLPELVQFGGVGHPRRIFAVVCPAVAAVEAENIFVEQTAGMGHAFVDPLLVQREHFERRSDFAALDRVVERRAIGGERVNVGRGEKQLGGIQ